jgi:diguanylate cyclase (GGDEF)-like protein
MADTSSSLQASLAALCESYAASLPDKLAELAALYQALSAGSDAQSLPRLQAAEHKLAGSAGTFGFIDLGNVARRLEHTLRGWVAGGHTPDSDELAVIEPVLGEMFRLSQLQQAVSTTTHHQLVAASAEERVLIGIVEDDTILAHELAVVLTSFGYRTQTHASVDSACSAFGGEHPDAWVLDLALPEGPLAGAGLAMILKSSPVPPPVAFISARNDFEARLAAARTGGSGYFVKPLDQSSLIDWLDRATHRREQLPDSILIVDDDVELASFHADLLRSAGMQVAIVKNPHLVMEALSKNTPDLILMDLHMPVCSGLEVAAVIRQQEAYLGLPIVYLSAESDVDQQQAAMQVGADDFLIKPINPERLVASVRHRVERARRLNMLMSTDSLTGLLKHVKIKEQLAVEMTRARRSKTSLAFVMFDMDHFKRVNDTHGHLSGDRVIKTLSHLLKQRLRRSDSIGRYGGEEFAAILPDCGLTAAHNVVEDIRLRFSELRFGQADAGFSVTLSAGIATFPEIDDPDALIIAADQALYTAKKSGRNCVCLAPSSSDKGG